jgi:hypothetical protein
MPGASSGNTLTYPHRFTYDAEMHLHDTATAIASSAAGAVGGSAKVVDFGGTTPATDVPMVNGWFVVDVASAEIASNDEKYDFVLELADAVGFGGEVREACRITIGANEVIRDSIDLEAGRYAIPFCNYPSGKPYRYARVFCVIAGTIATGVIYDAYLAPAASQ